MNHIFAELELLSDHAKIDSVLKQKLLATKSALDPLDDFCKIACAAGHPITIGELFAIGEEASDNQCKSTNGGNPTPYESFSDAYELFLASI